MESGTKKRKIIKVIIIIIAIIIVAWFCLALSEYYRVRIDKRPLICFGEKKDIESEKEYSKTCYGIFYKYREYYYNESNEMSAREFTLFFKPCDRKEKTKIKNS